MRDTRRLIGVPNRDKYGIFDADQASRRDRIGTGLASHSRMNRHGSEHPVNLLICEERCTDSFRTLASENGWALLEGVGSVPATRACVAMGPERVCVELIRPARIAPDIIRRLGAIDSVGQIACYVPRVSPLLERDLRRLGASVLTTVREAECWLMSSHAGASFGRSGSVRMRGMRIESRGLARTHDPTG